MSMKGKKPISNIKEINGSLDVITTPRTTRPPKGHRQKGAGTVIKDKPTLVTNDGVTLKCE